MVFYACSTIVSLEENKLHAFCLDPGLQVLVFPFNYDAPHCQARLPQRPRLDTRSRFRGVFSSADYGFLSPCHNCPRGRESDVRHFV